MGAGTPALLLMIFEYLMQSVIILDKISRGWCGWSSSILWEPAGFKTGYRFLLIWRFLLRAFSLWWSHFAFTCAVACIGLSCSLKTCRIFTTFTWSFSLFCLARGCWRLGRSGLSARLLLFWLRQSSADLLTSVFLFFMRFCLGSWFGWLSCGCWAFVTWRFPCDWLGRSWTFSCQ